MQASLVALTLLTLPLKSVLADVGAACDGGQCDENVLADLLFGFYFLGT